MELDEARGHVLRPLEHFEHKLDRSGKIVRDFIQEMRAHIAKLRKALDTVSNEKAVEFTAHLDIPNLDW